ncbi:MAG: glycosyltransferase, partial [Anaerolineales bacterium]|nr:glycosyltransferase [Anaerolineales bacterium]
MKRNHPVIVGVSDVSVGYGSPQLPALMRSLLTVYPGSIGYLLEPDQSERMPYPDLFPEFQLLRLSTHFHPFSMAGIIEYNLQVIREVNRLCPQILVLSSPLVVPVLWKLRFRPRATIYYMLESLTYYAQTYRHFGPFVRELTRSVASQIDLVIFPEENRAVADVVSGGLNNVPMAIVYNAVNPPQSAERILPATHRFRRLLYSGTIQRGLTFAEYFLHTAIRPLPIDLYGLIEGPDKQELLSALLTISGNVHYRGYVNAAELGSLRKRYIFSLVMWAPTNDNQLYACPNKFFEAIADGVPPITTPHPQSKLLIKRYQCGILMRDWSFESFYAAVQRALSLFGTERYEEMVENCRRAVKAELNWEAQF